MARSEKQVRSFGKASVKVQGQLRALAGAFAGVFAARQFARGITSTTRAFAEQQRAVESLRATLSLTGRDGAGALDRLTASAARLQTQTTAADEAIIAATSSLGNLAKDLNAQELEQAQAAIIGIADTFLKGDVQNAALLLGKSIGSTTNALTRYGIQVKTSGTQSEKLAQVVQQTGTFFDVAKAKANTLDGQIQQLSNAWGDLQEELGRVIADLFGFEDKAGGLKSVVVGLSEAVARNREKIVAWANVFISLVKAGILVALVTQLNRVRNAIIALQATTAATWAVDLGRQFAAATAGAGVARTMLLAQAKTVALAGLRWTALGTAVAAGVWWFRRVAEEVGKALGPLRETRQEFENTAQAITDLSAAEVQALLTSKQAFIASLESRRQELLYFLQEAKNAGGELFFQLDGVRATRNADQIRGALNDVTSALSTANAEASTLFERLASVLSLDPLSATGGGAAGSAIDVPRGTTDFKRRRIGDLSGSLAIEIPAVPAPEVSEEELRVNAARMKLAFSDELAAWGEEVREQGYTIGGQLISGLIDGTVRPADLARAAVGIASMFFPPLKLALGIFSPSRVTFGMGQQLAQGMVLGMDSMSGAVSSAASRMATAATPALADIPTGGAITAKIETDDTSAYPPWALDWLADANVQLRYAGEG